jgi:hypothetical protein
MRSRPALETLFGSGRFQEIRARIENFTDGAMDVNRATPGAESANTNHGLPVVAAQRWRLRSAATLAGEVPFKIPGGDPVCASLRDLSQRGSRSASEDSADQKNCEKAPHRPNETQDQRPRPRARRRKLNELTTKELRIGAASGSLHRLVRCIFVTVGHQRTF